MNHRTTASLPTATIEQQAGAVELHHFHERLRTQRHGFSATGTLFC
jgi:hypothetical protein